MLAQEAPRYEGEANQVCEQVKVRSEKRYSFEAMDRLPTEVKKAKTIGVLRDKGVMRLEQ